MPMRQKKLTKGHSARASVTRALPVLRVMKRAMTVPSPINMYFHQVAFILSMWIGLKRGLNISVFTICNVAAGISIALKLPVASCPGNGGCGSACFGAQVGVAVMPT